MLRLLQNFRRQMQGKDSFRKYTLYAVGEILLVVTGILIALQVNNWNQERIGKNKEAISGSIKIQPGRLPK